MDCILDQEANSVPTINWIYTIQMNDVHLQLSLLYFPHMLWEAA